MLCDRDIVRQHARGGTVVRGHTRSFRLSVSANILEGEPLLYETFSVGGRRAHEETHGETDPAYGKPSCCTGALFGTLSALAEMFLVQYVPISFRDRPLKQTNKPICDRMHVCLHWVHEYN